MMSDMQPVSPRVRVPPQAQIQQNFSGESPRSHMRISRDFYGDPFLNTGQSQGVSANPGANGLLKKR
eukprot:1319973-Amorphochlora_amoeboformis.AAC.2